MAKDVSRLLTQMQTGQYIPTDEEMALSSGPQKKVSTNITPISQFKYELEHPTLTDRNESLGLEAGLAGYGTSRFDTFDFDSERDLEHARAVTQSSGSKILNGAIKGGITAATTAVETVAGVVDGLLEGGYELARQAAAGESMDLSLALGKGTNNFVARTMSNIQKLSEEWFPNNRTEAERSEEYQDEWWKHVFTANFIGDSFLKNFGFTAGALVGGAVWSKMLSAGLKGLAANNLMKGVVAAAEGDREAAAGLTQVKNLIGAGAIESIGEKKALETLANAAKPLNKMSTLHQLFGGVIGAVGEGTFEGVNARDEFLEKEISRLRDERAKELSDHDRQFFESLKPGDGNAVFTLSQDGRPIPMLTEKGQLALEAGRQQIADKYAEAEQYANELADRVASTTLALNIPILTVQNVMVYGKMLSGGFNTARNVSKVTGNIAKVDGKLAADLTASGSRGAKIAANISKNGLSEGAEEMAQGFISRGAKHVADSRMTSFNDAGYDRESMKEYGNWVGTMLDGGMEYLKEGRNWQEGFLGLLTGLVGIPGKGYFSGERGGVIGAVADANKSMDDARKAADELNTLVNSEKFQNAWKGYIRHQKYETDMEESLRADDKYSWKTASDQQLVNDVITFANAGRLQDLKDIVDYYAGMSNDDSEGLEVLESSKSPSNEKEVDNNPGKVIGNVKQQAEDVKKAIDLYNQMYDSMNTIAPVGTSRDQIEEMIAAAMNIKAFEDRFMSMFSEVLEGVKDFVKPIAERDDNGRFEKREEAYRKSQEIYDTLGKLFTSMSVPANADIIQKMEVIPTLRRLKSAIEESGDKSLSEKVNDMAKLAQDRRAFVEKLTTLENLDPATWNKEAETPEDALEGLEKEAATEEAESFTSLGAVKAQYEAEKKRHLGKTDDFISRMRKAKDSNSHVAKFLDVYDTYNELRQSYIKQSGALTGLAPELIDDVFLKAGDANDVYDTSKVETYEQYIGRLQKEIGESTNMTDEMLAKTSKLQISKDTYNAARDKVVAAMNALSSIKSSVNGRKETVAPPAVVSTDAPLTESTDPTPASTSVPQKTKKTSTISEDRKSAVDATGRTWIEGEVVHCYDSTKENPVPETGVVVGFEESGKSDVRMEVRLPDRDITVSLNNQVPFINKTLPGAEKSEHVTVTNPVDKRPVGELADDVVESLGPQNPVDQVATESDHYGQRLFYQNAIPEFDSKELKELREAKTKDEKRSIIKKLKSFIIGKEDRFGKLWNKLTAENAFTNAVNNVKVGDAVKFIALPGYEYDGKPMIFMAVEKDGQRYIYNTMRRKADTLNGITYAGLQDFCDAFDAEYSAYIATHPNTEFTFSKTSKVWGKRDGIIEYAYTDDFSSDKGIVNIEGYDKEAPIVWITGDGQFETLRGDSTAAATIFSWRNMDLSERLKRRGQLFYLANDGNGGYIPISLGIEHFTPDNYKADNPTFNSIREALSDIEGITGRFFARIDAEGATPEGRKTVLSEENEQLHSAVSQLKKYLNLTNGFFTFAVANDGKPLLIFDKEAGKHGTKDAGKLYFTKDTYGTLTEKIAEEKLSLDFRPKHNLTSFVNNGFLTSNANKLLPKNVDVYIEHWENGGFNPTQKQKELQTEVQAIEPSTELSASVPANTENILLELPDNPVELNGGFVMIDDFNKDEIGSFNDNTAVDVAKNPWDRLTGEQQSALVSHYGEDIIGFFNDVTTSEEDRQNVLECVGVK